MEVIVAPTAISFAYTKKRVTYFITTKGFGDTWEEPIIDAIGGILHVKTIETSEGVDNTEMSRSTHWYVLEGQQVKRVETEEHEALETLKEVKSSDLSDDEKKQGTSLVFDIDSDGEMDTIKISYWERWGSLQWEAKLSSTSLDSPPLSGDGKRIGILPSKTNGVHDLVNHIDMIYRWDGNQYRLEE